MRILHNPVTILARLPRNSLPVLHPNISDQPTFFFESEELPNLLLSDIRCKGRNPNGFVEFGLVHIFHGFESIDKHGHFSFF